MRKQAVVVVLALLVLTLSTNIVASYYYWTWVEYSNDFWSMEHPSDWEIISEVPTEIRFTRPTGGSPITGFFGASVRYEDTPYIESEGYIIETKQNQACIEGTAQCRELTRGCLHGYGMTYDQGSCGYIGLSLNADQVCFHYYEAWVEAIDGNTIHFWWMRPDSYPFGLPPEDNLYDIFDKVLASNSLMVMVCPFKHHLPIVDR